MQVGLVSGQDDDPNAREPIAQPAAQVDALVAPRRREMQVEDRGVEGIAVPGVDGGLKLFAVGRVDREVNVPAAQRADEAGAPQVVVVHYGDTHGMLTLTVVPHVARLEMVTVPPSS